MSSRLSRIILPKRKDDGTGEVFGVNEELIGGDLSGSSGSWIARYTVRTAEALTKIPMRTHACA